MTGLNWVLKKSKGSINMIQTAEGAPMEISNLLISMREPAIHAANEGFNDADQLRWTRLRLTTRSRPLIASLHTELNPEAVGEIAENLDKLYALIINQTNMAEATKDLSMIDDNISVLDSVRLDWLELKRQETEAAQEAPQRSPAGGTGRFTESARRRIIWITTS
jgi:flagellin-specific chaperone FliS